MTETTTGTSTRGQRRARRRRGDGLRCYSFGRCPGCWPAGLGRQGDALALVLGVELLVWSWAVREDGMADRRWNRHRSEIGVLGSPPGLSSTPRRR